MDSVEDQVSSIKTEWGVLKERWFQGEPVDPVFEGIVREFCVFDYTMQDVYKKVEKFMKGIDALCEGLMVLSESAVSGLSGIDDQMIKSDCYKMKEATNQITRADAPHSAIAKLRRDMDFNIMGPMRNHIINNRSIKANLEKRRRKLLELNVAKKAYDDMVSKNRDRTSRPFLNAQSNLESAKMNFHDVDKHIFEWLYILEEYRGDILDSCLQTLKYLQYEFFASAAHAVSAILPARMEFRPMVEMTPEHLEAQVDMELREAEENEDEEVVTDFSVRLIEKLAKDNKNKPGESVDSQIGSSAVAVDPLSLAALLSQGFEEGPARQALRKHGNDTQAALDFLVGGGEEEAPGVEDGVRMPTTVRRVQRLKAQRRAQQERRREQAEQEEVEEGERNGGRAAAPPPPPPPQSHAEGPTAADSPAKPPAPMVDLMGLDEPPTVAAAAPPKDLLGFEEEPPPPTDFSRQVETLPLPPMQTLDLTRCEKPPLPASMAAGTAPSRLQPAAPSLTSPTGGAGSAASGSLSATQSLVAQAQAAQISPQQLLLAAQQLAAQQQLQPQLQQQQPAGGVADAAGPDLASLDPFATPAAAHRPHG